MKNPLYLVLALVSLLTGCAVERYQVLYSDGCVVISSEFTTEEADGLLDGVAMTSDQMRAWFADSPNPHCAYVAREDPGGRHIGMTTYSREAMPYIQIQPGVTNPVVMAHELGHAMGREHSTDPNSVMYPKMSLTREEPPLSENSCESSNDQP